MKLDCLRMDTSTISHSRTCITQLQLFVSLQNYFVEMKLQDGAELDVYSWLTSWIRILLEKLLVSQLFKKLPAFYVI